MREKKNSRIQHYGYMTKTLNQIILFSSTKINIFFSNIENQNIFLEKKT